MGAAASVSEDVSLEKAKELAGSKFDEARWRDASNGAESVNAEVWNKAVLEDADTNKDGVVTKEELRRASIGQVDIEKKLEEIDRDKDNEITSDELLLDAAGVTQKSMDQAEEILDIADKNEDKKTTTEELAGEVGDDVAETADLNNDGVVSQAEAAVAIEKNGPMEQVE